MFKKMIEKQNRKNEIAKQLRELFANGDLQCEDEFGNIITDIKIFEKELPRVVNHIYKIKPNFIK